MQQKTFWSRVVLLWGLTLGCWAATLPADLKWETNDSDPAFASPEARPGGTLHLSMQSFPLTFRTLGPDANGGFRSFVLDNQLRLISFHPNSGEVIPALATHWAIADDHKTVYFRLDPEARWSDGKPVTADDYLFGYQMMKSKVIRDPWMNNYYSTEIVAVTKYDDYTLSVQSGHPKARLDLMNTVELWPQPRHYYQLTPDWVKKYNWAIVPNTGPYQISDFKKGKSIRFRKVNEWWGKDRKYFRHRFNLDSIELKVIRDEEIAWRHFLRGDLETVGLVIPEWWHDKSDTEEFKRGYIDKYWFYTDSPEGPQGVMLNTALPRLADLNVRLGIQHAFNIQKTIDTLLRGDYQRMHSFGRGYGAFDNRALRARAFDIARARDYFAKAGYRQAGPDGILMNANGERLTLQLTYSTQLHTQRLSVLKEEAKKAGLELRLNLMDGATAFKSMLEKKHEGAWVSWGGGGLLPQYWEFLHSANAGKPQTNNLFNIADAELDRLVDAYQATFDEGERAGLSRQIQQRLHDLAIFVPGYSVPYTRAGAWRYVRLPRVPGTRVSGMEGLFWPMDGYPYSAGGVLWIDPALKQETEAARQTGKAFEPRVIIDKTFQQQP